MIKKDGEKLLFTPGPLTTSMSVKRAMLADYGSHDGAFINYIAQVRKKLLSLAHLIGDDYTSILMPGSGTYGVEAVLSSAVDPKGKLLLIINGAYGRRMASMAEVYGINACSIVFDEDQCPDVGTIKNVLQADTAITDVAVVHCETTTGILNDIQAIGKLCNEFGKNYIVDAMSSFGAVPINFKESHIDYVISSSNKCIEGVPGFSFIICNINKLRQTKGFARTLSLDIYAQYEEFCRNGEFRYTPPVHAVVAFHKALEELEQEGGVEGRAIRYKKNYSILVEGMQRLGFKEFVPRALQGYIITSFITPKNKGFDFEEMYERLKNKGFVIYHGKLNKEHCFRIGNIGHLFEQDMNNLLSAIDQVLREMNVTSVIYD